MACWSPSCISCGLFVAYDFVCHVDNYIEVFLQHPLSGMFYFEFYLMLKIWYLILIHLKKLFIFEHLQRYFAPNLCRVHDSKYPCFCFRLQKINSIFVLHPKFSKTYDGGLKATGNQKKIFFVFVLWFFQKVKDRLMDNGGKTSN